MTDPAVDRPPTLLERLIASTEQRRRIAPDDVPLSSAGFTAFVYRTALPFIGGNAVLWGLYQLARVGSSGERQLLWVAMVFAAVSVVVLIVRGVADVSIGVLATALMLASSGLFAATVATTVTLIVAGLIASLIVLRRALPVAAVLVSAYLPFAVNVGVGASSSAARVIVEGLALTVLLIACAYRDHRTAARAVLVIAAGVALYETSMDAGYGAILIVWFATLGIVQEIRTRGEVHSSARRFTGGATVVLLIWVGIYQVVSGEIAAWTTFAVVLAVQLFLGRADRASFTTRISWPALALIAAIWQTEAAPASARLMATLAVALSLHLLALLHRQRFPSDLAVVIALAMGGIAMKMADDAPSLDVFIAGILSSLTLLLLADRPTITYSQPWWTGFVAREQLDAVGRGALVLARPLWSTPVGSVIANYARTGYGWLKLVLGSEAMRSSTLLLLAAHACGAFVLARQGLRLADSQLDDPAWARAASSAAWLVWGSFVVASGSRRNSAALQLAGLAFLLVPVADWWDVIVGARNTSADFAVVVIGTGAALWLISYRLRGMATTTGAPSAAPPTAANNPDR